MKVGYFLIFIFAILNFLGLKQTEFEIRQLDSTARILTTHAEAIQAAQEQPTLNAAAAAALTRADGKKYLNHLKKGVAEYLC